MGDRYVAVRVDPKSGTWRVVDTHNPDLAAVTVRAAWRQDQRARAGGSVGT